MARLEPVLRLIDKITELLLTEDTGSLELASTLAAGITDPEPSARETPELRQQIDALEDAHRIVAKGSTDWETDSDGAVSTAAVATLERKLTEQKDLLLNLQQHKELEQRIKQIAKDANIPYYGVELLATILLENNDNGILQPYLGLLKIAVDTCHRLCTLESSLQDAEQNEGIYSRLKQVKREFKAQQILVQAAIDKLSKRGSESEEYSDSDDDFCILQANNSNHAIDQNEASELFNKTTNLFNVAIAAINEKIYNHNEATAKRLHNLPKPEPLIVYMYVNANKDENNSNNTTPATVLMLFILMAMLSGLDNNRNSLGPSLTDFA